MGLCLLAAVRVFVYSAAFPFFNNVDEQAHFDLVIKYSRVEIPRQLERMSPESCRYMALYASPEYFRAYPVGETPPPLWTMPEETRRAVLANLAGCESRVNHESSQAPLYYALAALWLRIGGLCGLAGGALLYWIRFLNVGLAAALVWLGYVVAEQTFPEERFMRLGVPLLLAVLPQDAYYAIQNDVLSPLCFGLAFLGLVCWLRSERPGAMLNVGTGLAVAAVCLVKVSNLPLLAVAAVAVLAPVRRGKLKSALLVLLSAGLPIALWVWWNLANYGDASASAAKMEMLGWTHKPIGEWWSHPIFTPAGFAYYWSHLIPMFWRGELVWNLQRLASPAVDAFYWISSALLAGAAVISLKSSAGERPALILAASSFFASVGYLALLSIALDFGNSYYPSRALPYFISGRLLLGALIPFLLLYVHGLDWLARRLRCAGARWWLLAAMALLMAGSQLMLDRVAFASAYNWFHLIGRG